MVVDLQYEMVVETAVEKGQEQQQGHHLQDYPMNLNDVMLYVYE